MSTLNEKLLKEAKKLPWEDRLMHKNWKVRNDANVDLAALCDSISDPKDPRLLEFGSFFRKTIADSNVLVQEKALDALISFLKAADADVGRYAKEICDAIFAKCLTGRVGRPKTVENSQMVLMLWIELGAVDAFLDAIEEAIKNKVAKVVVSAIDLMVQALSEFGKEILPPERILKMLPELFVHQNENVRASSENLTLELCRWIGKEPLMSILFKKMRGTMKNKLEAELVKVSGTARPSRKLRFEKNKEPVEEVVGFGPSEESGPPKIGCVDAASVLTSEKAGLGDGVVSPLNPDSFLFNDLKSYASRQTVKWPQKGSVDKRSKLNSQSKIALKIRRSLEKCLNDENLEVRRRALACLKTWDKSEEHSEVSLEDLNAVGTKNFLEMNGGYGGGPACISLGSDSPNSSGTLAKNLALASARIPRELELLRNDDLMNCSLMNSHDGVPEDLFRWKARITGGPDGPYAGVEFLVDILFAPKHPFVPPKVVIEKVFHPNIDITGDIHLDILQKCNWTPAYTIVQVLHSICSLLAVPGPAYCAMPKITESLTHTGASTSKLPGVGPTIVG